MYSKVINPLTNRQVGIHTRLGQTIIRNYIISYNTHIGGGGDSTPPTPAPKPKNE